MPVCLYAWIPGCMDAWMHAWTMDGCMHACIDVYTQISRADPIVFVQLLKPFLAETTWIAFAS